MRYVLGDEERKALGYIKTATAVARNATCERSRCGSVIVQGDEIIGRGYNSPPLECEDQRRCSCLKDSYHRKVTDKTCCVHAEQRAIVDALRKNPHKISGSRLFFIRLDNNGRPARSGEPYCTICSKMVLDVGIADFVLWRREGVCVYDAKEYNLLSYKFGIGGEISIKSSFSDITSSQSHDD